MNAHIGESRRPSPRPRGEAIESSRVGGAPRSAKAGTGDDVYFFAMVPPRSCQRRSSRGGSPVLPDASRRSTSVFKRVSPRFFRSSRAMLSRGATVLGSRVGHAVRRLGECRDVAHVSSLGTRRRRRCARRGVASAAVGASSAASDEPSSDHVSLVQGASRGNGPSAA